MKITKSQLKRIIKEEIDKEIKKITESSIARRSRRYDRNLKQKMIEPIMDPDMGTDATLKVLDDEIGDPVDIVGGMTDDQDPMSMPGEDDDWTIEDTLETYY